VTVRIFGHLRKVLSTDSIELEARTVGEALDLLRYRLERDDAAARRMLDRAVVLVNGRNIASLAGADTALGPSDEMTILQQVAGG
jgi:molybdopterin converting factor small subunit